MGTTSQIGDRHWLDWCSLEKKDFEPYREISIPTFRNVLEMR
jgi:hypothetical protein